MSPKKRAPQPKRPRAAAKKPLTEDELRSTAGGALGRAVMRIVAMPAGVELRSSGPTRKWIYDMPANMTIVATTAKRG